MLILVVFFLAVMPALLFAVGWGFKRFVQRRPRRIGLPIPPMGGNRPEAPPPR